MNIPELLLTSILEDPLYKKRIYKGQIPRTSLADIKPINFSCEGECDSIQTFSISKIDNQHYSVYHEDMQRLAVASMMSRGGHYAPTSVAEEKVYTLVFKCLKCKAYDIIFTLAFIEQSDSKNKEFTTTIQKIGQLPAIETTLDKSIERWLPKRDKELYKKGIRCESNGFGIGAFGYFRRIVENNISKILEQISESTDSEDLRQAIEDAKKRHNAQDRLELVKDHAPKSFMLGDQNVFSILYSALSKGLHGRSDEKCLEDASSVRVCLHFLIRRVADAQTEKDLLKDALISLTKSK